MRVIDRFGPYGPALAPGVTVQESDQPAITDDRLAQRPFQRLIPGAMRGNNLERPLDGVRGFANVLGSGSAVTCRTNAPVGLAAPRLAR